MPRVERLEVSVTGLPGRLRRQMAFGGWDTGEQGDLLGKPVLLKVHAEGIVGYAQIRPNAPNHFQSETVYSVLGAIKSIYGPALIGQSIFDTERIAVEFDRRLAGNRTARALIDVALHDAMGKATDRSVCELIGGRCQEQIPLEWSVSLAPTEQEIVDEAVRAVQKFHVPVLCVKAGSSAGWRADVRNFAAVREAVGPDITIGVDPNTGWSLDDAVQAVAALRELGLGYLEQPISREDIHGMAALRTQMGGIPLLADEAIFTPQDAYGLARARAVDAFCLKIYKTAGLSGARKIAAIAEAANIRINVGGLCAFSQLEAAASAHLYASLPERLALPAAEFVFGLGVLGEDPVVPSTSFVMDNGWVRTPTGPGLGLDVDDDAIARHALVTEVIS